MKKLASDCLTQIIDSIPVCANVDSWNEQWSMIVHSSLQQVPIKNFLVAVVPVLFHLALHNHSFLDVGKDNDTISPLSFTPNTSCKLAVINY